jgi:hypothetical protein
MDIPRFKVEEITPRLFTGDLGTTFQQFSGQVLRVKYPGLHTYPAAGKDGAIDHSLNANCRSFFESKHIGNDGRSPIFGAWKEVAGNLRKHLSYPGGPPSGQGQYRPWYRTEPPIENDIFCVSAVLGNEDQQNTVGDEISAFFQEMAAKHPHLAHLALVNVEVKDWSDLCALLEPRPHLIFRWFHRTRPNGLVPLEQRVPDGSAFRSYLERGKLPYYRRDDHLRNHAAPDGTEVLTELDMMDSLRSGSCSGMIIHGQGGVGKTRLTMELGWQALDQNWTVLRVEGQLKPDALARLAEALSPDTPVLLLVDYIETQDDFAGLVEEIESLNETYNLHIRYVASCRCTYYQAAGIADRHLPVNLSPPRGDPASGWLESYQRAAVEHILRHCGVPITPQHLEACRQVPVLAVFMSYVHDTGRGEDLHELLGEQGFGRWVTRRVQLSFQESIQRALATLVALFPMDDVVPCQSLDVSYRSLFDRLAADGWIEKEPPAERDLPEKWVTAHDVLADQIVLAYAQGIAKTVAHFVDEVLHIAGKIGCLSSALFAFERLADQPPFNAICWLDRISVNIASDQESWLKERHALMRTSLLTLSEQIALLEMHVQLRSDRYLSWIARSLVKSQGQSLPESQREKLAAWITDAAANPGCRDSVFIWGLQFAPHATREPALKRIRDNSTVFGMHAILVAWMQAKQPLDTIRQALTQWHVHFATKYEFSYVVRAWLKAGGEQAFFEQPIQRWLGKRATDADSQFFYKMWLDAGGTRTRVAEAIQDWLEEHARLPEARFVYQAWLEARGEKSVVERPIRDWLSEHCTTPRATFVYEAWLDNGGGHAVVAEPIQQWLTEHGTDSRAQFVFKAWLDAGGNHALVEDSIRTWLGHHASALDAEFVFAAWLKAKGARELIEESLKDWLSLHAIDKVAQYVYAAWVDAREDVAFIEDSVNDWMTENCRDLEAQLFFKAWLYAGAGRGFVQERLCEWLDVNGMTVDAAQVCRAWLENGGEPVAVERYVRAWLAEHAAHNDASYVHTAWLRSGGGCSAIETPLRIWLDEFAALEGAQYVYQAWLEANGSFAAIQQDIAEWLHVHHDAPEAAPFLGFVVVRPDLPRKDRPDLPTEIVRHVLAWCRICHDDNDAMWRFSQLGNNLRQLEIASDFLLTAEEMLAPRLQGPVDMTTGNQITTILSLLLPSTRHLDKECQTRIDLLLVSWLRHSNSFGRRSGENPYSQHIAFVYRLRNLLSRRKIDPHDDHAAVQRFLTWVNSWDEWRKDSRLRQVLESFRRKFPANDLWDTVRFP